MVTLAASLIAILFYVVAQGTYTLELFSNFGLITYMGVAAIAGVIVFLRQGRGKLTTVSLGFAVGLAFWVLGLLVYSYSYYIVNTGLPYLSLADVFYLLTYPAVILGAVGMLRLCSPVLSKKVWVIVAVSGILFFVLDAAYVIPSSINNLTAPLEIMVTILYPTLDITVFLVLLPVFFGLRKGVYEKAFAFICFGAALLALGDLFFTVLNVSSVYYDGHPVDLLLFFGSISVGYGFWRQYFDLKSISNQ